MRRWQERLEGWILAVLAVASMVLVARLWLSLPSLTYLPTHNAYTPPPPVPVVAPEPLAIEVLGSKAALELPDMAGYRSLWQRVATSLPPLVGGQAVPLGAVVRSIVQAKLAAAAVWPSGVPLTGSGPAPSLIVLTAGRQGELFWLMPTGWRQLPVPRALTALLAKGLPTALAASVASGQRPLLVSAALTLPAGQVIAAPVPTDQLVPSFLPQPLSVEAIDEGADGVAYTDGSTVLHVDGSGGFQVEMGTAAANFFGLGPVPATLTFISAHPGFSPDLAVSEVSGSGPDLTVRLTLTVEGLPVFGLEAASVQFRYSDVVAAASAAVAVTPGGATAFSTRAAEAGLSGTESTKLLALVPVELDQNGALTAAGLAVLTDGQELLVAGAGG